MNKETINRAADNIRILSAAMVEKAKSGHPGGAMGGADFINILYSEFLNFDPENPEWINRDRFFLDPGHMSPMLYSILTLNGFFNIKELSDFRQWGSPTAGHPEKNFMRGIENTSGPLGQGHTMAVGAAIAEKFLCARFGDWMSHKIYTFISDGGMQEEISQGAGRIAGHLGLGNLIMFFDSNDIQLSTGTEEVTTEDYATKYKAWGWDVITINGNNQEEIRNALQKAVNQTEKPFLIIGKTIMGKGALTEKGENFERQCSTHGMPLTAAGASFDLTVKNLGGDPENPFVIFEDVKEYYKQIRTKKTEYAQAQYKIQEKWEKENPKLAKKLKDFFNKENYNLDFSEIVLKKNVATRTTSGIVLANLADKVDNMIVASADLSNSDKTENFLKKTKALKKNDFSGAFLQAGVAELTMAAIANGIALHGGIEIAIGTFFVFSDYMKPAIRMAALMELPVKYIWTHDTFRVGEDGPTHQPIEQEAQIRLLEKLKNHSNKNSMLVLRPADASETVVAWKMAIENQNSPTALILSRQNVKDIPAENRYKESLNAEKGAYEVKKCSNPDLILVGNGSEVSTLMDSAKLIEEKTDMKIKVVSAISEGIFRNQSLEYQKEIITDNVPVFGLTAGIPLTLQGFTGNKGYVYGMQHFGYSAPANVLDEKLGFTPDNIYKEVMKFMGRI